METLEDVHCMSMFPGIEQFTEVDYRWLIIDEDDFFLAETIDNKYVSWLYCCLVWSLNWI